MADDDEEKKGLVINITSRWVVFPLLGFAIYGLVTFIRLMISLSH